MDENTIWMHTNVSASGMFEELIHIGQLRRGIDPYDFATNLEMEIEAKERLLKYSKAYGISEYEKRILTDSLEYYKIKLSEARKTKGGG
jgi:hypothetical protein